MSLVATTLDAQARKVNAPERSGGRGDEDHRTKRTFLGSTGSHWRPAGWLWREDGVGDATTPVSLAD